MISRVLVANRSEIALRVIRTARDLGITSIAVYADSDRDAQFVTEADEAYALGGTAYAETYMNADKLLDVAARSHADAVHPGYGFLSEIPGFAQAVLDAGIVWSPPRRSWTPSATRSRPDGSPSRSTSPRSPGSRAR